MTIIEALKNDRYYLTVEYGSRWLFWDEDLRQWRVNEKLPKQKIVRTIIETTNESEAVSELLKG